MLACQAVASAKVGAPALNRNRYRGTIEKNYRCRDNQSQNPNVEGRRNGDARQFYIGRITPVRAVFWRAGDCPPYLRRVGWVEL